MLKPTLLLSNKRPTSQKINKYPLKAKSHLANNLSTNQIKIPYKAKYEVVFFEAAQNLLQSYYKVQLLHHVNLKSANNLISKENMSYET